MNQKFFTGIETSGNLTVDSHSAVGETVFDVQGTQGQLFSVTNGLSGDLFSVSDISGIPIFNVNSSGSITLDGVTTIDSNLIMPTAGSQIKIGSFTDGGNNSGEYANDDLVIGDGSISIYPHRRGDYGLNETTATSTTFRSKLNIWSDAEDHITFGGANTHMVTAWEEFKIWINNDSSSAGTLHLYNKTGKTEFAKFSGDGTSSFISGKFFVNGELEATSLDINGNADISGALTLGTALAVAEGGTGATNLNALVQTSGNQIIAGVKQFSDYINASANIHMAGHLYNTNDTYSIDLNDHSGYTWFRNASNRWVFQGGTGGDDWTQSFHFNLETVGSGYNDKVMRIGQQQNNSSSGGKYKGVRIVKSTGSSTVVDGYLQAGDVVFSGGTQIDGRLGIGTAPTSRNLSVFRDTAGSIANFLHYTDSSTFQGLYIQVSQSTNDVIFQSSGSGAGGFKFYAGNTEKAGIDASGNITLSGTVDGVDIAALATANTGDQDLSGLAPKASPTFTGTPAAPTASAGTSTTQLATTAFVGTAVSNLVDSAPGTLNTLNELAAALGDDASFSTTVTNSIATKLPLAGGTITGNLNVNGNTLLGNALTDKAVVHGHLGVGDDNYPKIAYPGQNALWSGNSTTTGQIVIDLPGTLSNYDMMYMEIDIYEYSSKGATKLIIGGHNWNSGGSGNTSSTQWHNVNVQVIGALDKPVYFGRRNDGTSERRCIAIGETNSTWVYATVQVHKVHGAEFYGSGIDWVGDWNIDQTTSDTYFTKNPTTNFNSGTTLETNGNIFAANLSGTNTGDQTLSSLGAAASSHNHDTRYLRKDTETQGTQLNLGGEIASTSSAKLQVYGFQRTGPIMIAHGNTGATSWNSTNEKWLMNNTGNLYIGDGTSYTDRIFHDSYHPNADTLTTARTLTIGSTGKTFNGGANVSWTLGEIGAAATSHNHAASEITSGTLNNDRLPEYILNKHIYQSGSGGFYMPMVKGGILTGGAGTTTGRLRITIPHYQANSMQSFIIDIYEYNTDRMQSIQVGGYSYSDSNASWYNTSVIALMDSDNRDLTVRFGANTTAQKQYVAVGEVDTTWGYPQVVVRNYMAGHSTSSAEMITNPFTVEFVTTDSATYNDSHSNNQPYANWSKIEGIPASVTSADTTPSWVPSSDPSYLTSSSTQSKYIRSDVADTASDRIEFRGCDTNNHDTIATSTGSLGAIEIFNNGSGNDAFMTFHVGGDFACYFGLDGGTNKLSVGGWSMGAASYEIYHSGNLPSLSTLGAQAAGSYLTASSTDLDSRYFTETESDARFLKYKGVAAAGDWDTIFTTGTGNTNTSGLFQINNHAATGNSNTPTGSYTYGSVLAWQLPNATFKLYAPHTGGLHYQTGWNNDEYSGWRKIWDSGNDGASSGLDADLLDGQHASAFAPIGGSTGRFITGGLYGTGHGSSILPIWQYNAGNPGYGIGYTEGSPDNLRIDVSGSLMSGTPDFQVLPNEAKINGNTVHHAGNTTIPSGNQIIDWSAENAGTIHVSNYIENVAQTSVSGAAGSAAKLTDGGGISTHPGTNNLIYTGALGSTVSGLFAAADNSNSILTVNRHTGDYNSQLGFSSNGNLYYRKFSNSTAYTTQAWKTLAFTDNAGMLNSNVTSVSGSSGSCTGNAATATTATNSTQLNGFTLARIDHAEDFRTYSGLNASATQAKRYHVGRLYGCPAHWDGNWQNLEINVTAESYESANLRFAIMGDYGGANTQANMIKLYLKEASGPYCNHFRFVLGTPVDAGWDHSSQDTYYVDLYAEVKSYGQFKMNVKSYGHGIQSANPTSGGATTVFYDSPTVSNISAFSEEHNTIHHLTSEIYHEGHKPTLSELGAQAAGSYQAAGNYITGTGSLSAQDLTDIGNLSGTNTGDQTNISGNAATATNVAYSGLTGTVPTWNQNTTGSSGSCTGNAATATTANAVAWGNITSRPYIETATVTSATTTTTVASVVHGTYTAAFFDFVIKNGTNVRAGIVYACHDGASTPLVEFAETSTVDLGDTSDVTLSVDISGTNMRLRATTTSSTWTIKALTRAI